MSPVRTAPFPDPQPSSGPQPCPLEEQVAVAGQLHQRLLTLDYPQFARCICRLLEALGYEQAHLAGRRLWKGYNRPGGGGYDIEAILPGGLAPRRVIAQIKQFDSLAVHQRTVDELRGACLRTGAAEGLLVTTSAFSEVVRRRNAPPSFATAPPSFGTSEHCAGLAVPVRLIDGQELLGLLIHYRIGVRERVSFQDCIGVRTRLGTRPPGLVGRCLVLDEAFFAALFSAKSNPAKSEMPQSGSAKSGSAKSGSAKSGSAKSGSAKSGSALPRWRMTVRIFPANIFPANTFSSHTFPARIFPARIFPARIFWGDTQRARRRKRTSGNGERNDARKKDREQKDSQKKGNEQKGER